MSSDDTTQPSLPGQSNNVPLGEVPPNPPTPELPVTVPDPSKGRAGAQPDPTGKTKPPIPPAPANPPSKALALSLGSVAAVLLGVSGYQYYQGSGLRQSLAETQARTEVADAANKDLDNKLVREKEGRKADAKGSAASLAAKEQELTAAAAKAKGLNDELEQETAKGKKLESKLAAALSEASETTPVLAKLQEDNNTLTTQLIKATAEVARLKSLVNTPKPPEITPSKTALGATPSISPEPKKPFGLAWVRLVRYEDGKNKGRCSFAAPDGFVSDFYPSRAAAVAAAELRAGVRQLPLINVSATSAGSGPVVKTRVGTQQSHVVRRSSK